MEVGGIMTKDEGKKAKRELPERWSAQQKGWRRLSGYELLAKVIKGVKFVDSVEEVSA